MGWLRKIIGTPRDRFARLVLRTVRSAGVEKAWYDAEGYRIGFRRAAGGNSNSWIYLDNVFGECARADRAERDERIARLVESIVAIPKAPQCWDEVRSSLRPVLRPATFAQGSPAHAPSPLSRPTLPFLREFVVIDRPMSMAYVTRASLETWGVNAEQVFAKARANLAEMAALPDSPAPDGPVLMRFVESGDAYFVSRLLVYGWLASLASRVGGRPVAFAPDQNTLVVTDDRPDALGPVFELVEKEYGEAVRGISPQAYTVDDAGEVVPYHAPRGHPLAAQVHRAEAILAANEYANQQAWLERHDEGTFVGEGVFVASLGVAQRQDGSLFTFATWTEDVDSLLPRADFVGFSSSLSQDVFLVLWQAVEREVDLVPVDGLDPVRFRVHAWPSPPVVERLRAEAVNP